MIDGYMLDPRTVNFMVGIRYLQYVFGVTTNGNTIVIEKIKE